MIEEIKMLEEICLYAIKNQEGQWFRRKGYGGTGDTWVDDFGRARIYTRIGPARGVISFFANHYSTYPAPSLVKLVIGEQIVVDEKERIAKQKKKKEWQVFIHDRSA